VISGIPKADVRGKKLRNANSHNSGKVTVDVENVIVNTFVDTADNRVASNLVVATYPDNKIIKRNLLATVCFG